MNDHDPMKILRQCCDMFADDLRGQPLHIERPGRDDMVLVASETYSRLLHRISELEAELRSVSDQEAEEEALLRLMVDATNSGPLH